MSNGLALGIYDGNGAAGYANIVPLETSLGGKFTLLHTYGGFNMTWTQILADLTALTRNGSNILFSWATNAGYGGVTYDNIASGAQDTYLISIAQGFASWGKPVMIRLAYEMNMFNSSTPWAATPANGGTRAFIQAWQHIVRLFQQNGAFNVRWVWGVHGDPSATNWQNPVQFYPGDSYVDWIGLDVYSWNSTQTGFDTLIHQTYNQIQAQYNKPIMIPEVGCVSDSGQAAWLTQMFQSIVINYPLIRLVSYFNIDLSGSGQKDWRFSTQMTSEAVFTGIMNNPV